jgi:hypothetical protein
MMKIRIAVSIDLSPLVFLHINTNSITMSFRWKNNEQIVVVLYLIVLPHIRAELLSNQTEDEGNNYGSIDGNS